MFDQVLAYEPASACNENVMSFVNHFVLIIDRSLKIDSFLLNDQGSLKDLSVDRSDVFPDNPDEEKKGVQVLEIAHFFLQKTLASLSKNKRSGGYVVFSDPDDGKSISFERTGTGAENTAYGAHKFEDRPTPITDKELESATCLDDYLVIRSYDDIYSILHAKAENKEDIQVPEEEETTVPEEEEIEVPEEMVEPPPPPKAATKRSRKESTPICPVDGGTFGETLDEFDACDTCALVDACAAVTAANK